VGTAGLFLERRSSLYSASEDNIRLWNIWETPEEKAAKRGLPPFKLIPGHHGGVVSQICECNKTANIFLMYTCSDRRTTAVPGGRKWPKAMARPEHPNSANPLHTGLHIALYLYLYFYIYTVYFLCLRPCCITLLSTLESVASQRHHSEMSSWPRSSLQGGSTEA